MTTNNHPAHGPVSLERLHQISEILSKAATQSDGGNLGYAMADAVKVIDSAIASFGAEPVAIVPVMYKGVELLKKDGLELIRDGIAEATELESMCMAKALLSARPAPVVPEWTNEQCLEFLSIAFRHAEIKGDLEFDDIRLGVKMVNGGRAAMLQGSQPVSNRDELPLDYLQGHKDGLEWAAQLAEANHPQTGDWLYDDPIELAKAIRKGPDMPDGDGNSPVTPDCWCRTCRPVTMSDMRFVVCPDCGNKRCPHANDHRNACTGSNELGQIGSAYPAAPQQEVKNG
ncbi:hypothetical protein P6121_000828 [Citrobacter freundii]|jgi:hypothetical protein|uniref:hypothetical protein n=1 Tax=Citrobacter freundii TaxID=546 RepID=UPI001F1FC248|nr:hypothetical protein [Citrobacter freundii]